MIYFHVFETESESTILPAKDELDIVVLVVVVGVELIVKTQQDSFTLHFVNEALVLG